MFKIGDVVKMKMGGPLMTVNQVYDDEEVNCIWFDNDHRLNNEDFQSSMLEKVNIVSERY